MAIICAWIAVQNDAKKYFSSFAGNIALTSAWQYNIYFPEKT